EGLRGLSVHVLGTVVNAVTDHDGHDYYGYGQGYGYGYGNGDSQESDDDREPTILTLPTHQAPGESRPAADRELDPLPRRPQPISSRSSVAQPDSGDHDIEESLRRLAQLSRRSA
ncbi:MAG TPA: hypothetical protein VIY86_04250, partial [Pirellulaceae bacterium]